MMARRRNKIPAPSPPISSYRPAVRKEIVAMRLREITADHAARIADRAALAEFGVVTPVKLEVTSQERFAASVINLNAMRKKNGQ